MIINLVNAETTVLMCEVVSTAAKEQRIGVDAWPTRQGRPTSRAMLPYHDLVPAPNSVVVLCYIKQYVK